jgi:hypothetical protein
MKKRLMFLPGYGPSDHWLVNPCAVPSIGQTWVLASNNAVFEMGDLIRTLKRLLMECTVTHTNQVHDNKNENENCIFVISEL